MLHASAIFAPEAWAASSWTPSASEAMPFLSLATVWGTLLIAVVAVAAFLSSRRGSGRRALGKARKIAAARLDAGTCRLLHDVTLKIRDDAVHFDLLVVSTRGLFVIATPELDGEIDGSTFAPEWTRSSRGGTATFPNPLRPNFDRKLALAGLLKIGEDKIFSVVAFTTAARFRNAMPDNVTLGPKFVDYMQSKDTGAIAQEDIPGITNAIRKATVKAPQTRGAAAKRNARSPLRFMNLLKFAAMAAALSSGAHVLHNTTQFPNLPDPLSWFSARPAPGKAEITRTGPLKSDRKPSSEDHAILVVTARRNTRLNLIDPQNGRTVLSLDISPGQSREVELRKGYYTAEIIQDGKLQTRRLSVIAGIGALEL